MKRKLTSVFALATTLTVIATGCGTKTEVSTTPAASEKAPASTVASTPAAAKKDVTLTVGASQNWIKDIDRKQAEAFMKETGIKIDFQVNPDDQYTNILKTKISTHEAPDVIYMQSGIGMDNFQPDKNFLDLSNEPWAANLKGWAKSGASINGKLYGFNTWSVDGWGVLYNTDLFAKYSLTPPKTYAEFAALCDKLLANGITPVYENGKDEWHLPLWLSGVSTVAGAGADLTAKFNKNEAKFADQAVLETAMTQLNDMNKKGYFGKNVLSNDWDHGYEAMGSGKYAMDLVYTTYQQEVVQKFPNSGADKWKMFPIPLGDNQGFATSSGGVVRVVNKESKNIDAVKQYFAFLSKPDNLKAYYTERKDLGEASFNGIEVAPPTVALKSINEIAGKNISQAYEVSLKFWDGGLVGKSIQDMLAGASQPKQVLQKLDESRDKSFKVAK